MSQADVVSPFHEGERAAQKIAGVGDVAQWAGGFIRDYFPEQHRAFHTAQPFLVLSGMDAEGQVWITLVDGPEGFITSPDTRTLDLATQIDSTDPLAAAFASGTEIGAIGIELATRRRNRFSGMVQPNGNGFRITLRQSFGNCPQYIHERAWTRVPRSAAPEATRSTELTETQIELVKGADTLFIGTGHQSDDEAPSNGFDASHRGGAPGFVHVVGPTQLQIPDYPGNNFFNTIGNIMSDPRVGLVFVDFETGGLLHITGRASVDWAPEAAHDPDALRVITVDIDAVVMRPEAVGLRWQTQEGLTRRLRLAHRETESDSITSFYFEPLDQSPLEPFEAGQHLPVEVQIPGQRGVSKRSYSLSGTPADTGQYRISVKREPQGLVSRFLHDTMQPGAVIDAHAPSGDFVVPCSNCPLVLVSAGVGLTPMLAALHANAHVTHRDIWYVHGARNGRDHALHGEVAALVAANANLHRRVYFSRPEAGDVLGQDYDVLGRISAEELIALGAGPCARYMLCGPSGFLSDLQTGLEGAGVAPENIYFETFGPTG